MKPTGGRQGRWLLALGAITLAAAVSGCSALIAASGVSSQDEIYKPETRAEVREAFGEPDETGTCPDGRPVERRWIRQEVPEVWGDVLAGAGRSTDIRDPILLLVYSPVIELVAIPIQAYRSEQAKLHYAFVYGADDRVLYRYDVTAAPPERMVSAVHPLTVALYDQLEERGCPSWVGCVSAYAAEAQQQAACVGYTLTPEEAETLQLLEALAAEVDAGRLTPDDTLAELHWCLGSAPLSWSCHRP